MKRGRTHWVAQVPPAELQAIHERIDSSAEASAADVFHALNLVRYTTLRSFRRYVTERRREKAWRDQRLPEDAAQASPSDGSSPDALLSRLLQHISDQVTAGIVPAYALPGMLMGVCKVRETTLKEAAEKRAAEIHEFKLKDLRSKLKAEVDAKTEGGKTATREDLYQAIDRVLRGEEAA